MKHGYTSIIVTDFLIFWLRELNFLQHHFIEARYTDKHQLAFAISYVHVYEESSMNFSLLQYTLFSSNIIQTILSNTITSMVFKMYTLILSSLLQFALRLYAHELMENAIVSLTQDSFATELEKMPHFVMFTYPISHS